MRVVDAGVVVELLAGDLDPDLLGEEELAAPHLIDSEVTHVLRGLVHRDVLTGEQGDALRAQSPFGRVGTPEDVAAAVLYLTSPEAQWAAGAILDLNGASHLRT